MVGVFALGQAGDFGVFPAVHHAHQLLEIDQKRYTIEPMNGKDIIAKLKAAGWTLDRVNGSHHVMVKDGKAVPVPVHGTRDVGAGLLAAIARQSGVKLK